MNRRKWVRGKNRRAESNIVTAYLQNIEVSYSHLYQEMQQAVYDSETFARVDSDSDIYTYNRSIMAVKEYFQQLGISYAVFCLKKKKKRKDQFPMSKTLATIIYERNPNNVQSG